MLFWILVFMNEENNSPHLTCTIPFLFRCKSLYPESFRNKDFTPHKTCLR